MSDLDLDLDELLRRGAISVSSEGDYSGMKEWYETLDGQQWLVWWIDGQVVEIEHLT